MHGILDLAQAIAIVKASGYKVTSPRAPNIVASRPALNAVGKPLSPLYDPKYKLKTTLTSIARLRAPMPAQTQWVAQRDREAPEKLGV